MFGPRANWFVFCRDGRMDCRFGVIQLGERCSRSDEMGVTLKNTPIIVEIYKGRGTDGSFGTFVT